MMKTPCGKNALLILQVQHAQKSRKFYKKFTRFSLDISKFVRYSSNWQALKKREAGTNG